MAKLIGYIIAIIGLIIIASSFFPQKLPLPSSIKPVYIMIAGIVILIIGIALSLGGSRQAAAEVPIYEGKKIVGYRRGK